MSYFRRWLSSRLHAPVPLVFAVTLGVFEGVDIASVGLALPRMSRALELDSAQGGYCASASMLGLAIGAAIGGRIADIFGRRAMMFVFIIVLGIFSLASAHSWNFETLLVARFCTGLGIGGLMPILIALANSSALPRFRSTAVSIVMASGAAGGFLAALVSLHPDWRAVFYFGGLGPILMIPLMLLYLPQSLEEPELRTPILGSSRRMSIGRTLFGEGRLTGTLLVWVLAFLISLISYILVNWLPTLLIQKGASQESSHWMMMFYSIGGIIGNVVSGTTIDRGSPRLAYTIGYLGASGCILGLAMGAMNASAYLLTGGIALFVYGAQLVTFSIVPTLYPPSVRTTGIGSTVSAGRLGSVLGPLLVGLLLAEGLAAGTVLLGLIPICLASLALGFALVGHLKTGLAAAHPALAPTAAI